MLSTPACSAKDRSVVESTLKKRTPLNDCCMRRKCGSIRRHELQNLCGHTKFHGAEKRGCDATPCSTWL